MELGLLNRFNIVFDKFSLLELVIVDLRNLIRIRLNIETNSPLNQTKVGFIFIGLNSLSLLSITWHKLSSADL